MAMRVHIPSRVWFEIAAVASIALLISLAILAGSQHSAFGRLVPGARETRLADQFEWQGYFDAASDPPIRLDHAAAVPRLEAELASGRDTETIYRVRMYGFASKNESILAATRLTRRASILVEEAVDATIDPAIAARVREAAVTQARSAPGANVYLVPAVTARPLDASGRAEVSWVAPRPAGYLHNALIALLLAALVTSLAIGLGSRRDPSQKPQTST